MKVLIFISLWLSLYCAPLEFKAFGSTEREAKGHALSDLSSYLSVKVESDYNSYRDNTGRNDASKQLHISSNLPLGGARVTVVSGFS